MKITGTLENWHKDHMYHILWGNIYGDIHGRFHDGQWIHTSSIPDYKEIEFEKGMVVKTLNSYYLLGEPA